MTDDSSFTFVWSHPSSQSDGRTREARQLKSVPFAPPPPGLRRSSSDYAAPPPKRSRTEPAKATLPKRPVGRPRKDPAAGGVIVEFGSFVVQGIERSHSLPNPHRVVPPSAALNAPIAPIFGARRTGASGSEPITRQSSPPPEDSSRRDAALPPPLPPHERIIPETEEYGRVPEQDGEVDGTGLGEPGDDAGDDDEELAMDEEDEEEGGEQGGGQQKRWYRAPLPDWLQAGFDDCIQQCKVRNNLDQPRLYYEKKTFYFPKQSTYFLLQKPNVTPEKLYNPTFFLWDPLSLCSIPCPNCKAELQRHTHISRPRRVVSFNSTFWIVGFRYRCMACSRAKPPGKNVTFRSWDPRILERCSPELAAEFPARLSHRSAIDTDTLEFMRSCYQNGMGSKQFSDALRVQHVLKYDKTHLQYLQHIRSRIHLDTWRHKVFEGFLPFDDRSRRGLHGYVPSGQWVRTIYDRFIEEHTIDFDQFIALLSAEINAIDHSHKFTKHLIQLNGERVFTGLLTVTNERGEIRICCLVATKAHSQFELALQELSKSLDLYGLKQPIIFYTDNMSDRQFLMKIFPSLSTNTSPVEKYQHLPVFSVPEEVSVSVHNTAASINAALQSVMDDLPQDGDGQLIVGFDSEWDVQTGANDRVTGRGPTSVVQIAYKSHIYVLQISEMVRSGTLPQQLKILLSNPQILKVGRLIEADLKVLERACNSSTPFLGALDLAKCAQQRYVSLPTKTPSLSDLCAVVLGRCLRKNVPERVGEAWSRSVLTSDQIQYAACDAYVSLAIYNRLSALPIPQALLPAPSPLPMVGTHVLVFGEDQSLIARGRISAHPAEGVYDGIVLHSNPLVEISEVVVPGTLLSSHSRRPLSSFGPAPFRIVANRASVRTYQPIVLPRAPMYQDGLLASGSAQPSQVSLTFDESQREPSGLHDDDGQDQDGPSIGDIVFDLVDIEGQRPSVRNPPFRGSPPQHDSTSLQEGLEILGPMPTEWPSVIRSRVLKDPFHVFNMFYISRSHGLRIDFAQALRDAMFIPDPEDVERIEAWGRTQDPVVTYEGLLRSKAPWLLQRCKRVIPPGEHLYPAMYEVFKTWGPLKDAKTGAPLFNKAAWKTAKQVLELVYNGFLSDPPGIALYTMMGIGEKTGLPIYRCFRGTNATEGGVHTHLRSHLPTSGASIRHALACLKDFVLRHNLLVGTLNSTGRHYRGHFNIWISNEIHQYLIALRDRLHNPIDMSGWVNTRFYQRTSEVIGVLPIPQEIQIECGMAPYSEPTLLVLNGDGTSTRIRPPPHDYLAKLQGTRKAVLPIHTPHEKQLIRTLLQTHPDFLPVSNGSPNWERAVKFWNQEALIHKDVHYKLTEQLKAFYTAWKTNLNIKESLSLTLAKRKPVKAALTNKNRAAHAPPIPQQPLSRHTVSHGFELPDADIPPPTHSAQHDEPPTLASPTAEPLARSAPPHQVVSQSSPAGKELAGTSSPSTGPNLHQAAVTISERHIDVVHSTTESVKEARRPRSCAKCGDSGEAGCPGRQRVENCKRPCRDCGETACLGRDTSRLHRDKPCWKVKEIKLAKRAAALAKGRMKANL